MKRISSIILSLSIAASAVFVMSGRAYGVTQVPITRSQAETRALKMINLQWTYKSEKNSSIVPKYAAMVSLPKQFKNVTSAAVTGIPYAWGGLDSIDTSSYNALWTSFTDAINRGAYAGNVNTRAGYGYIPGTAGLDCSGFVQAAFSIRDYKLSTSSLFDYYFRKINLSDIKHMDILDKPGSHVVIFDKWGTMNGVSGAYTYEATTDQYYGGIQGTKKYFMTMSELNSGYIPGRYINIIESAASAPSTSGSTTVSTPQTKVTTSSSQPAAFKARFAKITDIIQKASLRATPSFTGTLMTTIPKNSIIYLNSNSGDWYKVNYSGKTGWISKNQVSEIESGKYVTLKLTTYQIPIKTAPSTTASLTTKMYKNMYARIDNYSANGSWFKLNVNGVSGWADGRYLSYIY